ncbi:MAG TPA: 50S ribosomal protein L22 [Pyrinomonadaceae bacterium]|nr:50S ribosomal protein L22 [Pyrinomonadaceae bacterium]HMP66069.1 50S ribosomal protein L22 [Pyrinomonadaceae bacterium]
MEAIARTKYLKGSPRKARLVIDLIRGQDVSRALSILRFTEKRAAAPITKCLNSAIANATYIAEQQNIAVDPDDLWIKACYVDMGPTKNRRRMRPAPQGRAYREQRHYCHITIEVTSEEKPKTEKELRAEAAKAKKAEAKKTKAPKKDASKKDAPKPAKKAKKDEAEEQEVIASGEAVEVDAPEEAVIETSPEAVEAAEPAEESSTADETAAEEGAAEEPAADETAAEEPEQK